MLVTRDKWGFDPDTLVYLATVCIGVPLIAAELWQSGSNVVVYALAILWIPTIASLFFDIVITERVSTASKACFYAWAAVYLAGGIYAVVR